MNREEGIRIIAYQIWEEEGGGCPGNDVQNWLKAETIWQERNQPFVTAMEKGSSMRNQQVNTAIKIKPTAVLSGQQNKKDQFPKRKP